MRKRARHVISQLLYLQMIMFIVDPEYARYISEGWWVILNAEKHFY